VRIGDIVLPRRGTDTGSPAARAARLESLFVSGARGQTAHCSVSVRQSKRPPAGLAFEGANMFLFPAVAPT